VELKLYSFCHYLRKIKFGGFSKWIVLSQAIKENHPQELSLMAIIDAEAQTQDEIYQGLIK
jgi:hypothetical protein